MQMLIWGFFISTTVLLHATVTINSFDHMYGRRRYDTGDTSRNNAFLAVITLGEGWHNNHHHYAVSARQGFFWWELDITYYVLKMLAWLGIVRDLRGVPEHVIRKNRIVPQKAAD
jgi:stearoyl-CoA desaturase (delta-9 desaturase)